MDTADATIRVYLIDDHEVVRAGLRAMLEEAGDLVVVGDAGTAAEGFEGIRRTEPDVAVIDVRLPDGSGVEVCRQVRSEMPKVACLMLTSYSDEQALFESIMAGAAGYVLKALRGSELVDSIRRVAAGFSLLDPRLTGRVLQRIRGEETADDAQGLSMQERRVLAYVGHGMTNRQIADAMGLQEKTVKNYVSHLLRKLGMERRTQAAVFAARRAQNDDAASRAIPPPWPSTKGSP
ncbi:MAG TPA: response regulator transcription factor [Acidimicrobiales bacterium]|nr:response regulator transcription factor [Acidimicrobiales bacterium]